MSKPTQLSQPLPTTSLNLPNNFLSYNGLQFKDVWLHVSEHLGRGVTSYGKPGKPLRGNEVHLALLLPITVSELLPAAD